MANITEQQILDALRAVTDPDLGQDVVSAGIITGLRTVDYTPYLGSECQLAQDNFPRCEAIIRELSSLMVRYSRDHPDAIRLRRAASLACCTTENQNR